MTRKTLGILGGMGPLASTAFLGTLYECNRAGATEQAYPDILLHSLSSVPDRTTALLGRTEDLLARSLIRNLRTLDACGVARIVICCFTSHALIHRLPGGIRAKIVSLVDLTARELLAARRPALLLASRGSYQKEIFASTEAARSAAPYIVMPDEDDQAVIHDLIYEHLKPGRDATPVCTTVQMLLAKYGLTTFIAGCTEFHLLTRHIQANRPPGIDFVDPLFTIARRLDEILSRPCESSRTPFGPRRRPSGQDSAGRLLVIK